VLVEGPPIAGGVAGLCAVLANDVIPACDGVVELVEESGEPQRCLVRERPFDGSMWLDDAEVFPGEATLGLLAVA
jgi:hypothetical protein